MFCRTNSCEAEALETIMQVKDYNFENTADASVWSSTVVRLEVSLRPTCEHPLLWICSSLIHQWWELGLSEVVAASSFSPHLGTTRAPVQLGPAPGVELEAGPSVLCAQFGEMLAIFQVVEPIYVLTSRMQQFWLLLFFG